MAFVFTGQFSRIQTGLGLLRDGRISRLFISGVNPEAGIRVSRFADQFVLDGPLRAALAEGRIVLGEKASNTEENAAEAACWLTAEGLSGPILLITSRSHMPRASLVLERALPDVTVERMVVPEEPGRSAFRTYATEFAKFGASLVSGWLIPGGAELCSLLSPASTN